MQQKITILAVGILTAAVFTTILVVTVQSAFATDGFKNCSPRNHNVCARSGEGGNTATESRAGRGPRQGFSAHREVEPFQTAGVENSEAEGMNVC